MIGRRKTPVFRPAMAPDEGLRREGEGPPYPAGARAGDSFSLLIVFKALQPGKFSPSRERARRRPARSSARRQNQRPEPRRPAASLHLKPLFPKPSPSRAGSKAAAPSLSGSAEGVERSIALIVFFKKTNRSFYTFIHSANLYKSAFI